MKKWKKALLLLMMLCLTVGQCIAVEAASKSSGKYKVTLNKTSYTMKKGASVKLKATKNTGAKKKKVVWSSSNAKIAAVSEKGKVTAKKNGKAVITAELEGTKVKASCKIVVGTPVQNIKLNQKSVNLEVGSMFKLTSKVTPKKPTNKKVVYKSSKKSVATVSSKGIIKAVKEGQTKITATAADGTGKSASCTVTVKNKNIVISAVSLDKTNLNLLPGQEEKLSVSVNPGNATNKNLSWGTSNAAVVTVNNGTVKAIGEGTAVVTATTDNGKSASCSIKVSYKDQVSNQSELNLALTSKMVTDIIYTSNASGKIEVPSGNYSSKTLEINAPNAEVTNNGQFKKVTINAIAKNTYEENSNNVIYFNAQTGRVVVTKNGVAAINLNITGNQSLDVVNHGNIKDISVPVKAALNVEGSAFVPVTLGSRAAGSSITTSTELQITSAAAWDMVILPGAENTKAIVEDGSCIPSVAGVGRIPVKVNKDNDVVNVTAESKEGLAFEQKVKVAGNVQEYYLAEDSGEFEPEMPEEDSDSQEAQKQVMHADSETATVYLLPFTSDNSGLNAQNYKEKITGTDKTAVTDASGNFEIQDIMIGNYWMIVEKDSFCTVVKNIMITSNNSEVYTCSSTALLGVEIANCDHAPEISGVVIDSLTGNSVNVSGIQVKLREGCGNVIGEALQTAQTDDEGRYRFENVPAGVYTVEVLDLRQDLQDGAIGYNSSNADIVVAYGYLQTNNYNCQVDQKMYDVTGQGRVQFTLTWGTEESGASSDIDSHLLGPKANGEGEFHIYYSDESYYDDNDIKMADLDVDDTDWEGPEHTTIYQETNGIYRFYVRNFTEREASDSDMLAKSSVLVRVTIGESSYTFNCPNQIGNLWYVCDYDSVNHRIIPKNEMSTFLGEEYEVGISEEEYKRLYLERLKRYARSDIRDQRSYLIRFAENDAKNTWLNRLSAYENQIEGAEETGLLEQVRSELEQMQSDLHSVFRYPDINADNLYDYNFDLWNEYDEWDDESYIVSTRVMLYCDILFGNTLDNFTVEAAEGQSVSIDEADPDTGYAYVLHVTDTASGLAYNVWVKVLADQAQVELSNVVLNCKKIICQFVENDGISADLDRLNSILESDISSDEAFTEAFDRAYEIKCKYQGISNRFTINTVDAGSGLWDWWTSEAQDVDGDENWLKTYSVLRLERDADVTDEEILSKLSIVFDELHDEEDQPYEISYEIVESDNPYYVKLVKATDGKYTKKIYIDISEW